MTEREMIRKLGLRPWDQPGGKTAPEAAFRGLFRDSFIVEKILSGTGFLENLSWRDGALRRVWVNPETGSIVTYCEGDVYLVQYNEELRFDAWWEAEDFYLNDCHGVA